jgi:acetyl esterase/lipase
VTDAAEWDRLLALPQPPPDRTVRYGSAPSQVVDLYGPGEGRPRITVLHGGYWRQAFDRTHLAPFAASLAADGFAVELVEYRRVGGGGGWPRTAQDVDAALTRLGGPPRILLGHSAGGQLALWAASVRERAATSRIVAVAPVADLARAHELRLSDGAVAAFLGGAQEDEAAVAAHLPAADPMRLMPRVPVELVHGTADESVPVELSRRYATDWGTRLHLVTGAGHFAPLTPGTPAYGFLVGALRRR